MEATIKTRTGRCIICEQDISAVVCEGCLQIFCFNHINDHRQQLNQQCDDIETNRDLFRKTLDEQINNPLTHVLIKQIDQWETDSIETIQKTAKECRDQILSFINPYFQQVEINLNKLTNQLKEIRQENKFNEIDLNNFKETLLKLEKQLEEIPNISIKQHPNSFIQQSYVFISSEQISPTNKNTKWKQNGLTIAGENDKGNQLNQLSNPQGIFVDDDHQAIYIADCFNHRILEWKYDAKMGQVVAGGNGKGNRMDQLNNPRDVIVDKKTDSLIICDRENRRVVRWPRQNGENGEIIISDIDCVGLAMDNNGDLYVSDIQKNEVKKWKIGEKTDGIIVAGGNGPGNNPNQLHSPTYLFVDKDCSVYVSDQNNHRVMKWRKDAKKGFVVAGSKGQGNSLKQLSYPYGVIVDDLGSVYVADSLNRRIICWAKDPEEGKEGKEVKDGRVIISSKGVGKQSDQFSSLKGLSLDREGSLYVVDNGNDRVQKFQIG